MPLLACIAEHADHLVPVAVGVGVDVALGGLDRADVLSPGRTGDALVHERERGLAPPALPGGMCPGRRSRTAAPVRPGCPAGRRSRRVPSPTSSSTSARRRALRAARLLCWPHQVPRSSLTMSSASRGLRTASSSRAARSISANSAFGGGPASPAPPARRPEAAGCRPLSPAGSLRRLWGVTQLASQISRAGMPCLAIPVPDSWRPRWFAGIVS